MFSRRIWKAGLASAVVAMSGLNAWAEPTTGGSDLKSEVEALRKELSELKTLKQEVNELRAQASDTWMTERRREEVRLIVQEVMADSATRSSLAGDGAVAGYNKNFFLASEDGKFRLNIDGQIQFRYIWDHRHKASGTTIDEDDNGFTMRRAKLGFSGHVIDPAWQYKIKAAFDRGDGDLVLEEAFVKYALSDQHYLQAGQFKARFLREELVSSSAQLTVERSNVNEFFTIDYAQGVELGGQYDSFNWSISVHDGREHDNTDFAADITEFAASARVEFLVAGSWGQFKDFQAWSKDKVGVLIGFAGDYAQLDHGIGPAASNLLRDYVQYSVDISVEMYPFNLYAAYIGRHAEVDNIALANGDTDIDQFGLLVQAGVFILPDKLDLFARWEHLDSGGFPEIGAAGSTLSPTAFATGLDSSPDILTFGTNYYFSQHASKFTFDVQWAIDGLRAGESGAGQQSNAEGGEQVIFRAQYQLLF